MNPLWQRIIEQLRKLAIEAGRSVDVDSYIGGRDLTPRDPYDMQDDSYVESDAYDEWLGSGGEPEYSQSWSVLQRAIEEEKGKKRKTKKLKKSSKGHSRYGRGGGAIPMDVLESKTAPRGLLGPRKRKY